MAFFPRRLSLIVLGFALLPFAAGPASSQAPARGHGAEAHDMELVGHDDLQGRSAYQPTIHLQRGRWIARPARSSTSFFSIASPRIRARQLSQIRSSEGSAHTTHRTIR